MLTYCSSFESSELIEFSYQALTTQDCTSTNKYVIGEWGTGPGVMEIVFNLYFQSGFGFSNRIWQP